MSRHTSLWSLLVALATGCGGVVITGADATPADATPADVTPADAAPADVAVDRPPPPTSPPCEAVRAACGPLPQQFVRGHAEGLTGLDGARARFAIRYNRDGTGGVRPDGVASAWATVTHGAFEACVCLPRGGNEYPMVAALVYAPGATGETSRDVARAMASQRFATLGDEELGGALAGTPPRTVIEAALAAMEERSTELTVRGWPGSLEGATIHAGLVSDARPVAAQITTQTVTSGSARLLWFMPGRASPDERVVILVDRNRDRRCDPDDLAASAPLDGRAELTAPTLVTGAALAPLCAALALDAPREI